MVITAVLIFVYGSQWPALGGLALMPAVVTAAVTYFLAIGVSPVKAAFGGAALVALLVALNVGKARQSTDRAVGDPAVR
ncbi:hypothetical protein [Actinokineospora sp.]|uniref:hypothetical protein n=1 Tax=Actinokineospora sp. TaxID=1872133 RepID=UPI003D6A9D47